MSENQLTLDELAEKAIRQSRELMKRATEDRQLHPCDRQKAAEWLYKQPVSTTETFDQPKR